MAEGEPEPEGVQSSPPHVDGAHDNHQHQLVLIKVDDDHVQVRSVQKEAGAQPRAKGETERLELEAYRVKYAIPASTAVLVGMHQSYQEIENLIWIEKNPFYKKTLEEWDRKTNLFASRVERKTKRANGLKNEIYNLVGFYSVFQGVLLTAVAQSSLLHCNNVWSPIFLSALASVVTGAGVYQKFKQIWELETTITSEGDTYKEAVARSNLLRGNGEKFRFYDHLKERAIRHKKQSWSFGFVIVPLMFFTAAFILSHWRILCEPGTTPYTHPGSSIILKEGNQGVYAKMAEISSPGKYDIHLDPNATYREYWAAVLPDQQKRDVIVGSDDCVASREITITRDSRGVHSWNTTKWRNRPGQEKKNNLGFFSNMVQVLKGWFSSSR